DLLVAGQARCVLFVLGMDPGGNNVLSCKEAFQPGSAEHLLERYTEMMTQYLVNDSAQWRLWHAAGQLFRYSPDNDPASSFALAETRIPPLA
ncbi:MAG: hypothetical protein ACREO9_07485, partial [Lysobacterales bacterium]